MGRLFSGTPWDRPPTCDRCGKLESACECPPVASIPERQRPASEQTAWIKVEKRPKGKVVTVVRNLEPGEPLKELASTLKSACGSGGTVKEGAIELQGDHLASVESTLGSLGYRIKRR